MDTENQKNQKHPFSLTAIRNENRVSATGFTLIETLIVVAIMAVLSSMLLTYNNSSSSRIGLYTDQATVAGALERAKSLALEKWKGGGTSACAFGVHFDTATGAYFVYQSMPLSAPCSNKNRGYNPSGDGVMQELKLSGAIEFVSAPQDIYFIPPYLDVSSESTLTIRVKGTTNTASVSVSAGGAVTTL